MVYNGAGVFLGTALANILTQLPKDKANVVVVPGSDAGISTDLIKKFIPISRYAGYITCGADTDFFSTDIEPVNAQFPVLFRVQIGMNVAGIFKVVMKVGSESSTYKFNNGVALTADCIYVFDVLVHPNDKINFQSSLAGIANIRIQEIAVGVQ